jgi:hypothetical protein
MGLEIGSKASNRTWDFIYPQGEKNMSIHNHYTD